MIHYLTHYQVLDYLSNSVVVVYTLIIVSFHTLNVLCLFCNRLSQDLAKDLAILAQEIHNVAGDGEASASDAVQPVSPASSYKEVTSHFSVVSYRPIGLTIFDCMLLSITNDLYI